MLSTATRMAAKLKEALTEPKIKQADVAAACNVSKQAVQGWLKTGRFDKKHLSNLSKLTGRPLSWWLDAEALPENGGLMDALQDWRLQASSRSQLVIDQLTLLAKRNGLVDSDWALLQSIAQRLAIKDQHVVDPQDLPLEVNADAQDVIDQRVREAQQRREQAQQQSQSPPKKRAA